MKNYPHLYTPVSKKASFSNQIKTQKKPTPSFAAQNQYAKNPSSKTFNPLNKPTTLRNRNQTSRISSRSIQQMYVDRSSQDKYDMMQRKKMLLEQHRQMTQFYAPPPANFKQYNTNYPHNNTNNIFSNNHYQPDHYSVQSNQSNNQLFQQSYQKIGQIRFHTQNKNIDRQLNQVLELIKQEKMRANELVKSLKKTADHYKKLCQNATKVFCQSGVNTQQQLPYFKQAVMMDVQMQCEWEQQPVATRGVSPTFAKVSSPAQNQSPTIHQNVSQFVQSPRKITSTSQEQQIMGRQKEVYIKLATMLEDMNISSKEVLPQQIELSFEVKDYKNLTETEIIKIQKFFIKKLVEKIPK